MKPVLGLLYIKPTVLARMAISCVLGTVGCGGEVVVPKELVGEWKGSKSSLSINATSLVTTDLMCSGNWKFLKLKSSDPGTWSFKASRDSDKVEGTIKIGQDGSLDITNDGNDCFAEGFAGTFQNKSSIKFPESMRGTWFSCGVEKCSKVKMMFTEKTVVVTGSGGGQECISATATIESITVDGPVIKVRHSGMTSSGWEMSIVKDRDAFDISGAGTFAGRYAKNDCTGGSAPPAARDQQPSIQGGNGGGSGGDCISKCMATQNACILRCSGKSEHDTQVCVGECAAKGQECMGGC